MKYEKLLITFLFLNSLLFSPGFQIFQCPIFKDSVVYLRPPSQNRLAAMFFTNMREGGIQWQDVHDKFQENWKIEPESGYR
jgi:hypothetical protein